MCVILEKTPDAITSSMHTSFFLILHICSWAMPYLPTKTRITLIKTISSGICTSLGVGSCVRGLNISLDFVRIFSSDYHSYRQSSCHRKQNFLNVMCIFTPLFHCPQPYPHLSSFVYSTSCQDQDDPKFFYTVKIMGGKTRTWIFGRFFDRLLIYSQK